MQTLTHPLISPALGTERHITSFHYGPRSGKKVYIQSSLHADELPGMLVATLLRRHFAALEAAGRLRDEIVVVPVPNPIGLSQHVFGDHLGRFELNTMQNFNRNFHDLAALVMPRIEGRLGKDAAQNLLAVRAAVREALDEQKPRTELESQRLALQRLSFDADVVLDLHCDNDAVMHLYTNPDLWEDVEPLARYLGARASLLAIDAGGQSFDEAHSLTWWQLQQRYGERFPIPRGTVSVTVEHRGQRDVSNELANQDAEAIVSYLSLIGMIDAPVEPPPPLPHPATPLAGCERFHAPVAGILVHLVQPGSLVRPGDAMFEIVDPIDGTRTRLHSSSAGMFYMRRDVRYVRAGDPLGRVTGERSQRTGYLLSA